MEENNSLETKIIIQEEETPPEQPKRKKLSRVLLLCGCLVFSVGVAVWAILFALSMQRTGDGFIYSYNESNKTAIVTGYSGDETDLIIPSETNDYVVVGIDIDTFRNYTNITSIFIPDTVTKIGYYNYATKNDSGAFSECTKLTSIQVGENNTVYQSIDGNLYTKDGAGFIQDALGKKEFEFVVA